jgi:hypothetical protein
MGAIHINMQLSARLHVNQLQAQAAPNKLPQRVQGSRVPFFPTLWSITPHQIHNRLD